MRRVLIGALLVLGLVPRPVAAEALTAEQVGAAYAAAGFEVDAPTYWSWSVPPVATLAVRAPARQQVVLAIVYADIATANAARAQGPTRLVPGYGPSAWVDNVALVQASQPELERWFSVESRRALGMSGSTDEAPLSVTQVTADFKNPLYAAGRAADAGRAHNDGAISGTEQGHHRT